MPGVAATVPGIATDILSDTAVISIEETIGAAGLSELVTDGLLFLGVGFGDRDGFPVILRSADARTWEEVESRLRGMTDVPRNDGVRNFTSLIKTETGYALLLLDTSYLFAEAGGSQEERTKVIRLTSERGAIWTVDPTFPIIEVEGMPYIFGHDEQHFGYVGYDRGRNIELRQLLEEQLIDGEGLEDFCSAAPTRSGSAPALRLYRCASGVEVIVDADNLIQPQLAEAIFSCATALIEMRGAPQQSVLVERDADPVPVGRLGTRGAPPILLPGGEVAVLTAQLPDGDVSGRCDGLVDGPAIEHWVEGELAARFTIPDDIAAATDLFSASASARGIAHADGLRLSLGGTLWDVSLVDGSWTRAIDLLGPDDGRFLSLQGDDEPVLLVGDQELSIWEDGASGWAAHPLGRRLSEPSFMYNHDNVVLVRDGGDPLVIRLSP